LSSQPLNTAIPEALRRVESLECLLTSVTLEVDARELRCPLPLLRAKQALRNVAVGELVRVLATDVGSLKDFVSFAQLTGQVIEGFCVQNEGYCYLIRKQ